MSDVEEVLKIVIEAMHLDRAETRLTEQLQRLLLSPHGPQAVPALRQALSVLRRSLPDAVSMLLTESDTVTLAPDAVAPDVAELCRLATSDDPLDLEQAAALYRGDFLEGSGAVASSFEDWMLQERSALREQAAALDACIEPSARGTLLVRGEAGIGKTSLSEAAQGLAQARGFRVLRLRLIDTGSEARGARRPS